VSGILIFLYIVVFDEFQYMERRVSFGLPCRKCGGPALGVLVHPLDRINNYVYRIQVYYSMSVADGDPAFDYLKFTRYN
jgi:hypothetical protein